MVKKTYAIGSVLVVLLGIFALLYFSPGEERKVKKQFNLLSKWLSKEPGESALTMAHHLQKIGTLFAETCGLKAPGYSMTGRYTPEEISGYAARARAQFSKLSLEFVDLNIRFPEKDLARVNLTVKVTGTTTLGEYMNEVHELECHLKKTEKRWYFSDVEVVEVLKK